MMETYYRLETFCNQIAVAVYINGIPIVIDRFHSNPNNQITVNQWVYSGKNTLDVNISVNPHFEHRLIEQNASVKIIEYKGIRPDFTPRSIKVLFWKYIPDETTFPVNLHDQFELDTPFGEWVWRSAQELTTDTIPLESLREFITRLHNVLQTKKYDELEPLLTVKASELADAYFIPLQERLDDQRTFFTDELFADARWGMAPLDFGNMNILYHAGGHLIEVVDRFGNPFLQSLPGEETTFSLPLRLCYRNNQWVLCR